MIVDLKDVFKVLIEDPIYCIVLFWSYFYRISIAVRSTVTIGKKLCLKGWPVIETINGGTVTIGNNVTLYSTKRHYFALLDGPVRLFAEDCGKIDVGDNTRINGATIHARKGVYIGKNCLIAANTSIVDSNGHKLCLKCPEQRINSVDEPVSVIIEDNVWIGVNCLILKGVTIGAGSVIGAYNVVSKSVEPNSVLYPPTLGRGECDRR